MANYAQEYTPELSAQFLAGELAPISEGEQEAEGLARQEGEEGGLIGKFSTAGKIAGARAAAASQKAGIIGQFNMERARAQYGERMTDENRTFQATEAQKQRDFQEMLTRLGYTNEIKRRESENRRSKIQGEQGLVEGALVQGAVSGIGGLAGGYGMGLAKTATSKATQPSEYSENDAFSMFGY